MEFYTIHPELLLSPQPAPAAIHVNREENLFSSEYNQPSQIYRVGSYGWLENTTTAVRTSAVKD